MPLPAPVRWWPNPARFAIGRYAAHTARTPFDLADFSPALRTRLLILQATPFCNIDCDYCYLPDRDSNSRMSPATIRRAATALRDDGLTGDELSVVWHAGEPLAVGSAYIDDAVRAIGEVLDPVTHVRHAMQTNATLIDDAWCALFQRHGVRVGVSVDGPAHLHDAHRRTRSGRSTHERVMRGIERLQAHGLPFHAIAVVTRATLAEPDAFFDFFEQLGIAEVGCNFDEAEGAHARSSLAGQDEAHAAFLARLLERSMQSEGRVVIREFARAGAAIAAPMPHYTWRGHRRPDNAQVLPFAFVSVACNGDFGTYSPELLGQSAPAFDDFVLGNVDCGSFLSATRSETFARLWSAIARGIGTCESECAHFDYCGGGAPANKYYENADLASSETLYCRAMTKRPFELMLNRLESRGPIHAMHPKL